MKEGNKIPANNRVGVIVVGVVALTNALVTLLLVLYMFFRN